MSILDLKKEILNEDPLIYTIDNFLDDESCEHFIKISNEKRGLTLSNKTSTKYWISQNYDSITKKIGEKIAKTVNIPLENAEYFQVIYYKENQEYKKHYDAWKIDNSMKSIRNMKYGGQRIKTALVYLNDVSSGGNTLFSKLNKEVVPKKGKILIFSNVYNNLNIPHELSEHAGLPILKGEKWAFNICFREKSIYKLYDNKECLYKNNINNEYNRNISVLDNLNFGIAKSKVITIKEINCYKNILSSNEMFKIIMNCYFEKKEKSKVWINKERIPEIIKKIEEIVKIDSSYFENMCVTKYEPNVSHNNHIDAFDLNSAFGRENINKNGQRLITIIGTLSETIINFPKLEKQFNLNKGDLLIYTNCYNEKNIRKENFIKNYSLSNQNCKSYSNLILFNIYITEKSKNKKEKLKVSYFL